ncbi:hypothetical protein OJF2_27250 [Aquisphaera giovannonii]|uniref:DUF4190 domain-containing protein n=1 Tax=Aquisphaera giovannonii TaxID=406548 RepID=A0A5B9W2M1_9BACT|nr:EsaB/YukD family protein [Aquisphaera giovannonii]QEH34190.1 hypothetical protein OJF2_27250 [Aquisphaera giovannonii]
MNNITIEVWDATGNKKQLVELPADAPINRVIAVLVDRMNLPRYSPDGQLMSYKFHHKASGRQLLDDQTLASADVHQGDILRLQPEITAGRGACSMGPGAMAGEGEGQKPCPYCGELVLAVARKCKYCKEYLDPELRRAELREQGLVGFVPVNTPASAIAAGYLGLLSLIPIFAPFALLFGIIALRTIRRNPGMGGRFRAYLGIVVGSLMSLLLAFIVVVLIVESIRKAQGRRPGF